MSVHDRQLLGSESLGTSGYVHDWQGQLLRFESLFTNGSVCDLQGQLLESEICLPVVSSFN